MEHKPEEGLTLVDALWKEEWLETRYLASALLRYIHPAYSENILDRVQSWALDCREDELLESLMTRSLSAIRSDDVEMFFSFLEEISTSSHQNAEKMILFSLLPLAKEEEYQDLPTLFSYLKPLLQSENESYLSALCQIMTDLAQRSEGETLFFLRHQIPTGPQPKITRVVRQSLPAFSPSSQEVLKEAIREK